MHQSINQFSFKVGKTIRKIYATTLGLSLPNTRLGYAYRLLIKILGKNMKRTPTCMLLLYYLENCLQHSAHKLT